MSSFNQSFSGHIVPVLADTVSSGVSNPDSSSSSSSKAVLAALRALQDKIRRLETERSKAQEETENLRQQLVGQEAEADQQKARDDALAQRNIQEARSAYDRLLAEKTDLEVRVARAEDRKDEIKRASDELQSKLHILQDEKANALNKIKDYESQHQHMEIQLSSVHSKEKDLASTLAWETKRHDDEMETLTFRLNTLQQDLMTLMKEKSVHDNKMLEMDHLVGQLLNVNETLVSKLTGAKDINQGNDTLQHKNTSINKKKNRTKNGKEFTTKQKANKIVSAASIARAKSAEIASKAEILFGDGSKLNKRRNAGSKAIKRKSANSNTWIPKENSGKPTSYSGVRTRSEYLSNSITPTELSGKDSKYRVARDVRSIKGVNKLYEDLVGQLIQDKRGDGTNDVGAGVVANSMALRAALSSTSPQTQDKHIYIEKQNAIDHIDIVQDCDKSNIHPNLQNKKEFMDAEERDNVSQKAIGAMRYAELQTTPGFKEKDGHSVHHIPTTVISHFSPSYEAEISRNTLESPVSREEGESSGIYLNLNSISKLEAEFQELDRQYHDILQGVSVADNTKEEKQESNSNPAESAQKLVSVIKKLHAVGNQLRELKEN